MKCLSLHLLTVIFILFSFVQCKNSVTSTNSVNDKQNILQTNLVTPENNTNQSNSVSFNWESVPPADSYEIQITPDENFSDILVDSLTGSNRFDIHQLPYDTTIYWKVRPVTNQQNGVWSPTWNFVTMTKPDDQEPISTALLSPEDGSEQPSDSVSLQWEMVLSAEAYKLQLATDQSFSNKIVERNLESASFTLSNLGNQENYYWRVQPIIPEEETEWSEEHTFFTEEEPSVQDSTVTLVLPADGASDLTTSPRFEWEGPSNAEGYQIQLANSSSFSSPVIDEATTSRSYTASGLSNSQQYYWRVQITGDGYAENWSSVFSFTTKTETASSNTGSRAGDEAALEALFESAGGSNWSNRTGWSSSGMSLSQQIYGVEVATIGGELRVTRLNLRANNLSGTLPSALGNLTEVTYFNVKQNQMSGSIPSSIGDMVSLTHLLLNGRKYDMTRDGNYHPGKPDGKTGASERSNEFIGQIPSTIGNLENLKYLEIVGKGEGRVNDGTGYSNSLTGAIPSEIGNLTNLIGLHLDYNSLTSVPSSINNLTHLTHIGLTGNALAGEAFPEISRLTNLRNIWMGSNSFSGTIPNMSNLEDLRIFIIPHNKLTGEIPAYLFDGTMPEINLVNLAWNELSGSLPDFGTPNNLKALQVDGNNLSGKIPTSVENIPNMINFSLGWNNFEGEIPDLSHMSRLRYVRGNDNEFTGDPPMVDTTNENLQFLHFHNNNMADKISAKLAEVGNLPKFTELNIRNSNFSDSDLQPLIDALEEDGNLDILKY